MPKLAEHNTENQRASGDDAELERVASTDALMGLANRRIGMDRLGKMLCMTRRYDRVQGSATAAFKIAGIRLDKLYRHHGAKLIIPMHDAYVFEAPLDTLAHVAEMTGRVMCESVQELFPSLAPRADINIAEPACWNKEGKSDALANWIGGTPASSTASGDRP